MENRPKLRDIARLRTMEPYPINEFPDNLIKKIGGCLVYLLAIERKDITGTDWGDSFAASIGGEHLDSPIGIADVVLGNMDISRASRTKLFAVHHGRQCQQVTGRRVGRDRRRPSDS